MSREVQAITIELQDAQKRYDENSLIYHNKTNLDTVYKFATDQLGMVHQDKIRVFSNREVLAR